jgi:hypothetical protein
MTDIDSPEPELAGLTEDAPTPHHEKLKRRAGDSGLAAVAAMEAAAVAAGSHIMFGRRPPLHHINAHRSTSGMHVLVLCVFASRQNDPKIELSSPRAIASSTQ